MVCGDRAYVTGPQNQLSTEGNLAPFPNEVFRLRNIRGTLAVTAYCKATKGAGESQNKRLAIWS